MIEDCTIKLQLFRDVKIATHLNIRHVDMAAVIPMYAETKEIDEICLDL